MKENKENKSSLLTQHRFMDQVDANIFADQFISDIYNDLKKKTPNLSIEQHNLALNRHIVDGNIITLWNGEVIIATANVMRTSMNWTHVVCHKINENIESIVLIKDIE